MGAHKRIRIRLKASDPESLARTFAPNLDIDSVFLGLSGDFELGAEVTVDLQYSTGDTALHGHGRVQAVRPPGQAKPGIVVAIAWDDKSRWLVEHIKTFERAETTLPLPRVSARGAISDGVSTEYASFEKAPRDELGPAPVPNALRPESEESDSEAFARPEAHDDEIDIDLDPSWESLSGEVTPLARIDLVRRSKDGPFSNDIEDSGGFERPHFRGEPVRSRASRRELPPKSRLVIGIDLGTTQSCAAIVEGGTARVIPTRRGTRTLPSAVTILPGGRTVVGESAMRQQPVHPANTIVGVKRLIGRPFQSPVVQRVREQYAYEIVEGESGEAAVKIGEHRISFEEISALLLKEIRDAATKDLGEKVNRAVITCPAHYNERQREAVRMAGELAGLHVERLLNEPTAAAINYSFTCRSCKKQRLLVYDLGGGMFDASLIEVEGDDFAVVATGGDNFLGGLDFDRCIVERLIEHARDKYLVDPSEDPMALVRLSHAAEAAKRELSEKDAATIQIDHFFINDWAAPPLKLVLTRAEAERMFDPLIERTLRVCQDVLSRAKLDPGEIDDIILVGGQTRSPLVERRVREMFEKQQRRDGHPDESVALGAANYAHAMESEGLKLTDALPASIGIGIPGGRFLKVIDRDTRLPAKKSHRLQTTRDGQSSLEVVVFQGEDSDVFNNELIGMLKMQDLPLAPAGEIAVTLTFELDEECLLKLSAKEERSGKLVAAELMAGAERDEIERTLDLSPSTAAQRKQTPEAWLRTKVKPPPSQV